MRFGLRAGLLAVGLGLVSGVVAQTPVPQTRHASRSSAEMVVNGVHELRLWGTLGGEKVELVTYFAGGLLAAETGVVAPGDYAVKVTEDKKTDRGIVRKYDVEMTPGKHVTFQLAGLEE